MLYKILFKIKAVFTISLYKNKSNMSEIKGKVIRVGETEQIKDTFKKRELVVETDDQYPQSIPVEFVQDKTELLNGLAEGDSVTVHYNLRGREWNGKYYVNVQGWRLEKLATASAPATGPEPVDQIEVGDDLPF